MTTGARPQHPFVVRHADVWKIAVPASVAFITEPLVGIVDITVIGRLGDAGLLGGLVLGALVFDVIFSMTYFLRIGTAGLTAQAVGARDPRDGLLHVSRALVLAVIIGLGMIALAVPLHWASQALLAPGPGVSAALSEYFFVRIWAAPVVMVNQCLLGWFYGRAAAATGMMLQILLHGINIVASIVLVFGFGMGVRGVALGTVLGGTIAAVLGLILLVRHYGGLRRLLDLAPRIELLDTTALQRMFGLSRDLMIRSAALMGAYAWFAAQGARMGEVALSANAVLLNLLMVVSFFLDGVAQAAEQLTGKAVGANWRPAFDQAYGLSFVWGLVLTVSMGLAWYFSGPLIIGVMTTNAEVQAYALTYLPIAALCTVTFMPAFVYDGILIGTTLNATMRNGMVISLVVFLAVALVAQPLLGNWGLWLALHSWFIARGVIYWWALERRKAGLFSPAA
ncbi:MATE family efflux transporter [Devosia neptuniae]|jgi:MATE family multidrug resistance protein|uniref:MATE family efflux transporter n=1 Tax=Devosia TaxID=46913 RepID=UPI0022B06E8C|nr:MATE family efflux transporter [Devosia neptuniae]MCZ4344461.1 MATE family efflux transporter [Devosia neptuniae]|tara:strand:- start:70902 stop:72257 length:1356 start_codon:yes stop_codon:yes gene_type:complete